MVNPKLMRRIKLATELCVKERDGLLPTFGNINVQDPVDVRKCLHVAIKELSVQGLLDKFDQDPTVANAPNGLIDLQTGKLRPHHPQDLCNNCASTYVPGALRRPTARFRAFLMDVLPPTAIEWLQMLCGYLLTGDVSEELFLIMNGLSGANGKGVFKKAIERAFGSYAEVGNKALFIKPSHKANASAATSAVMHIRSKRAVYLDESEKNDQFNDSFIKEGTDGARVSARELFCKTQTYVPQYKLCLFTNYRPGFPSDDAALIRRMVLIMFENTYKSADELDKNNERHRLMDTTLKPYMDSDQGAADVLDFVLKERPCITPRREKRRPQRRFNRSRRCSAPPQRSMRARTTSSRCSSI
jgi:P4 family phage/plasmid primase-like protien